MAAIKTISTILLATCLLTACAAKFNKVDITRSGNPQLRVMKPEVEKNIRELAGSILALSPQISREEAVEVAHDAYVYPMYLAEKWDITWPPMYHNTLRNAGVRKWGLCTDWASAMIDHMRKKHLKSMDIYWAVAYRGDPWREHSTLLITAKGQPFDTGIILDPWRDSGKLYWNHHRNDPTYIWKFHAGPYGPLARSGRTRIQGVFN